METVAQTLRKLLIGLTLFALAASVASKEALYDNYSGSYNTAIGNFAGGGNYSGSYNSFLGTLAGLSAGALPVSQTASGDKVSIQWAN